jgi:hypothetical protein
MPRSLSHFLQHCWRGDYPALWYAFIRDVPGSVIHAPCLQHIPYQPDDSLILDSLAEYPEQFGVLDSVEARPYVSLYGIGVSPPTNKAFAPQRSVMG